MKKKILAIALCAAMILGALAVSASARITFGASEAEAAPPPAPNPNQVFPYVVKEEVGYFPLWICGIQVHTGNMKDVFKEASKTNDEYTALNYKLNKGKVTFDPNTCTLTLDGATLLVPPSETALPAIESEFTYGDEAIDENFYNAHYELQDVTLTIKVVNNSYIWAPEGAVGLLNNTVIDIAPGKTLSVEGSIYTDGMTIADVYYFLDKFQKEVEFRRLVYGEIMSRYGYLFPHGINTLEEQIFAIMLWVSESTVQGYHDPVDLTVKGGSLYSLCSNNMDNIFTMNMSAIDTTIYAVNESTPYGYSSSGLCVCNDIWIDNSIIFAVKDDVAVPFKIGDNFSAVMIQGKVKGPQSFTVYGSAYPFEYSERKMVNDPVIFCNTEEYEGFTNFGNIGVPHIDSPFDLERERNVPMVAITVSIESDSYCASFRKVNAPENHAFMDIRLADGTFETVQFVETAENKWTIRLVDGLMRPLPEELPVDKPIEHYVGIENGRYKDSEEMYAWSWSPIFNCFYTTVNETEWVEVPVIVKEPDAKWYEVWKYHIEPRRYAVEVFKTYYLQTGKDGAKLTESPLFAASTLYQDRRNPTHTPAGKATGLGNGTHAVTCAACKKVTVERCKFNALTHRCTQCGSYDPKYIDFYTPLLTAELNDPINPTAVVFTVNVKMVNPTVKPAKVDYAVGEGKWSEVKGNRFIIQGAADQFGTNPLYIRVTDLNGMETIYKVETVLTDGTPLIELEDDPRPEPPQPPMPRP